MRVAVEVDLADERECAGYTQRDVGNGLGVSRAMISYWESGARPIPPDQLARFLHLCRTWKAPALRVPTTTEAG